MLALSLSIQFLSSLPFTAVLPTDTHPLTPTDSIDSIESNKECLIDPANPLNGDFEDGCDGLEAGEVSKGGREGGR